MHVKQMPFIRLLLPLITGILLQYYFSFSFKSLAVVGTVALICIMVFRFLPVAKKYSLSIVNSFFIFFLKMSLGGLVSFTNNLPNKKNCITNVYSGQPVLVMLDEPLVVKPKSYKANATIQAVLVNNKWQSVQGKTIIYFKKDGVDTMLDYGSQLIITTTLNAIKNNGNPGGFNYAAYCARNGIYYQCYLTKENYINTNVNKGNSFTKALNNTRASVLKNLRKYIHGKNEVAIGEALLIGYKNDLTNDLSQDYTNAGVVHIIVISGMHIAMIYAVLLFLFRHLRVTRLRKVLQPIVILIVVWGFTLMVGMAPSILRSAVMFTFIIIGDTVGRRTNIYNTLAASAFCMLVYQPNFLWDVGFQLSYAAVLSIILFMKPINKSIYIKNKILALIWQMFAITMAAQILTTPIAMYHFHQFPNLFLFTNFLVVPLSTIILFGEIFLIIIAFIPPLANMAGIILNWLLHTMNSLIQRTASLPYAVTHYIQLHIFQIVLLAGFACSIAAWLMQQNKKYLFAGLSIMVLFFGVRYVDVMQKQPYERLVVYNINKRSAIDVMQNGYFTYYGDTLDNSSFNINIVPSRTYYRSYNTSLRPSIQKNTIAFGNKKVLLIDKPVNKTYKGPKIYADIIIITGNPKLYMQDLARVFNCPQYVFDATNTPWKIAYWKKDCDSLHLRSHSVQQQGAFVAEL